MDARLPVPQSVDAAIACQQRLRGEVVTQDRLGAIARVAGVDVGFEDGNATAKAAVVVLGWPELACQEQAVARQPTPFPYVPGLLSFREIPVVLEALARLQAPPDLILCDGHGIAHPRRLGIASHLGVLTGLPTIGAAKSKLVGHHAELPREKGHWRPLRHRGETVGAALRSRTGTKPLYVSSGHCVSLPTAVAWVLRCTPRYRLPETTRQADRLASGKA